MTDAASPSSPLLIFSTAPARGLVEDCERLGLDLALSLASSSLAETVDAVIGARLSQRCDILWLAPGVRLTSAPDLDAFAGVDLILLHARDDKRAPRVADALLIRATPASAKVLRKLRNRAARSADPSATADVALRWKRLNALVDKIAPPGSPERPRSVSAPFVARAGEGESPLPVASGGERDMLLGWARRHESERRWREAAVFFAAALASDPTDRDTAMTLAETLLRADQPNAVRGVLKRALGAGVDHDQEALKLQVLAETAAGRLEQARGLAERLKAVGDKEGAAFSRSKLFELDLEIRAADRGLKPEDRPRIWWMSGPYPGNFGDILNPYIVEKVSGLPPVKGSYRDSTLAIGSVIKFAGKGSKVWGTGTARMSDELDPLADYRAVRGPRTAELVRRSGGQVPDIFGDAALLLPLLYNPDRQKRHKLGLIRHHTHAAAPLTLSGVPDINILRVGYDEIEAFLDEVLECEHILSTSLHGLIVAQAYGIPSRWCDMGARGRQIAGDGVKFEDHYATLGIPCRAPVNLNDFDEITPELASLCDEIATKPFDAAALLDAAPFPVLPEVRAAASSLSLPLKPQRLR